MSCSQSVAKYRSNTVVNVATADLRSVALCSPFTCKGLQGYAETTVLQVVGPSEKGFLTSHSHPSFRADIGS